MPPSSSAVPASTKAFDQQAVDVLACPACHGALRLIPSVPQIECVSCKRLYPLVDGIPVLISERSMR
jgi:hypothetical protein